MYFLSLYIIGPIILLNLFLAILLKNFDGDLIDKDKDEDLTFEDLTFIEKSWIRLRVSIRNIFVSKETAKIIPSLKIGDEESDIKMLELVKDNIRDQAIDLITSDTIKQSFNEA